MVEVTSIGIWHSRLEDTAPLMKPLYTAPRQIAVRLIGKVLAVYLLKGAREGY
jgi:hypothetical protein